MFLLQNFFLPFKIYIIQHLFNTFTCKELVENLPATWETWV